MLDELNDDRIWVRSDINYVRNPPASGEPVLTFVTEGETPSTMVTEPGVQMPIRDMRGVETALDREGFKLVLHTSAVPDFDKIEEDEATDQIYIDEMTALLQQVTGASRVIMLGGGKKRYGKTATDKLKGLLNALPALYPHGDTTDRSAQSQAEMLASRIPAIDLDKAERWALYNMWRPITPPPHDYPLAVCDARTVRSHDAVTVLAQTATRATGAVAHDTKGYLHNGAHRWWTVRDMTPGEVLIFKTHDSDPTRAHQVAHTAFHNPDCPADAPTRGSVEMRAFAIFN